MNNIAYETMAKVLETFLEDNLMSFRRQGREPDDSCTVFVRLQRGTAKEWVKALRDVPRGETPDKETIKKAAVEFFYWWHNQPGNNTAEGFDKWWASRSAKQGLSHDDIAEQLIQGGWRLDPSETAPPAWRKEAPDAAGGWWYWNCDPEDRPMRVDVVMRSFGGKKNEPYILQFSDWAANHEGGMWLREIEPEVPRG